MRDDPPEEELPMLHTMEFTYEETDFLEQLLQDFIERKNAYGNLPSALRNWRVSMAANVLRRLQQEVAKTL